MKQTSKSETAIELFKAFNNPDARKFVLWTMQKNYLEGILYHHPNASTLDHEAIKSKVQILIKVIFSELLSISDNPESLYSLLIQLGRKVDNRQDFWFQEFDEAYDNYKSQSKLPIMLDIFSNQLATLNSVIDIGCGGGDFINFIAQKYPKIQAAGADVLDWRSQSVQDEQLFDFYLRDFNKSDSELPDSYDAGILHAVLHHISSDDAVLISYLQNIAVSVNSLLVVEDILYAQDDLKLDIKGIESIDTCRKEQGDFNQFLELDINTQRDIIIILDLLSNSLAIGVPDMNFPFGARRLTDWKNIFKNAGFKITSMKCLGFQPNLFHRMSQTYLVLEKL